MRLRLRLDPAGGTYSAPQTPLSYLKKRLPGRKREGRGVEGGKGTVTGGMGGEKKWGKSFGPSNKNSCLRPCCIVELKH